MEKNDLDILLNNFINNKSEVLAEVYFVLRKDNETTIRFVDLEDDAQRELTDQLVEQIEESIVSDKDLSVLSISNADDRNNVLYEYDLDEVPEDLTVISEIIQNQDLNTFSFIRDDLRAIYSIVTMISHDENTLVTYKKHYPVNIFRKDSFSLKKMNFDNNTRFTKLKDDIVRVNSSFDLFQINGNLFIENIKVLEKFFGFHRIIKQNAENCIETIVETDLLDNPEDLKEEIDDVTFARKLTRIRASSPVLGTVPKSSIIKFAKEYPSLTGRFKFNDSEDKIILTSKKSKNLFVKLLNDDFLHSKLTEIYYDSFAKDSVVTKE